MARPVPDMRLEQAMGGVVAGIDEAGRAPLAGPVVAAAVVLPESATADPALAGLTDSKLLSAAERERFDARIRAVAPIGVAAAGAAVIDRLNILNATLLAMSRAVAALRLALDAALVDGNRAPPLPCPVRTVVGGDRKCLSIAAGSVVAKVARDHLMRRLARRYPGYGWESNMGYGTDEHYLGLLRLGATPHHRRSFAPLSTLFAPPGPGLRFVAVAGPPETTRLRLVPLRADLCAVCDGDGCHVGVLKATRGQWRFSAMGYDAAGGPVPGGGPLAACDGAVVPAARAAPLRRCLDRRLSEAAPDATPVSAA